MGCNAIHPGGERLPELLDEGPEEPNLARLAMWHYLIGLTGRTQITPGGIRGHVP